MVWSLGGNCGKNVSASWYIAFAAAVQMVGSRTLDIRQWTLLVSFYYCYGHLQESSGVELGRQRHCIRQWYDTMTWPIPINPLHLTRSPNTASGIRSQRQIQPRIAAYPATRTRGRGRSILVSVATRVERFVIINPVSGGDLSVRKLACFHLSDQDGAGIYETLDWESCCVSRGVEIVVCAVAVASLEAGNIEDVFDACPYTCERLSCSPGVVQP